MCAFEFLRKSPSALFHSNGTLHTHTSVRARTPLVCIVNCDSLRCDFCLFFGISRPNLSFAFCILNLGSSSRGSYLGAFRKMAPRNPIWRLSAERYIYWRRGTAEQRIQRDEIHTTQSHCRFCPKWKTKSRKVDWNANARNVRTENVETHWMFIDFDIVIFGIATFCVSFSCWIWHGNAQYTA